MSSLETAGALYPPAARNTTCLETTEQWTRFLAAFVHELRTPLASLNMLADLLGEAHILPSDPGRRYAETIKTVARGIQDLAGEAAELAQLLTGRAQVQPEEVDLQPLAEEVAEAVRPLAWERGIAVKKFLDPALPHKLWTDPGRLRRALVLLLSAAVGRAESEAFFQLDFTDGKLCVLISSDGPPFPPADPQALLEPFHDDLGTAGRRRGRSLALPLANETTRLLSGTLSASNRDGKPTFELRVAGLAR